MSNKASDPTKDSRQPKDYDMVATGDQAVRGLVPEVDFYFVQIW